MNIAQMASDIANARKTGVQTQMEWPTPAPTLEDAQAVQEATFAAFGAPSVGWKIGATNKPSQESFGIQAPFYGPIAASGVLQSGDDLPKKPIIAACEPEYAFKMARDFPAQGEEVNVENAAKAIDTVHCAIEVIGRCIGNPDFGNGIGVTMDFGGNAAFVIGPEIQDWAQQDFINSPVISKVDGKTVHEGNGKPAMGNPINSLVWLAALLAQKGGSIKAGEWVSTGTCTPPVPAQAGTTYTATFGTFGDVVINFS